MDITVPQPRLPDDPTVGRDEDYRTPQEIISDITQINFPGMGVPRKVTA